MFEGLQHDEVIKRLYLFFGTTIFSFWNDLGYFHYKTYPLPLKN